MNRVIFNGTGLCGLLRLPKSLPKPTLRPLDFFLGAGKLDFALIEKELLVALDDVIDRQFPIANGASTPVPLPRFAKYTMCNLRGGVGKTTLSFNISFITDGILVVDTCPQGNLSYYYDNQYYSSRSVTVRDLILPRLIPNMPGVTNAALRIEATNSNFVGKPNYYLKSSDELYILPAQIASAMNQAMSLSSPQREASVQGIIFSLKKEITRELQECNLNKCLIDTSPFFSGATQLAWYAADALIIPVRTDQQSVNSLELLIRTLNEPQGEFRRYLLNGATNSVPKIQMVVLTHCGWSTARGARNIPNNPTKMYAQRVYNILSQHRSLLSTNDPDNHLFLLDDFLGAGRISSLQSKPITLLQPGDTAIIDQVRVTVNPSVDKCKNQLKFITELLW
jgi:cellulose biosynthesis protein BcsQ